MIAPDLSAPAASPRGVGAVAAALLALSAACSLVSPRILPALAAADGDGARIDFNRDIRPILSNHCFRCHGPDASARKGGGRGGLRLDVAAEAVRVRRGAAAIVPGKPEESLLVERIRSSDPDERMPPAATGKQLSAAEIARLEEWIRGGAPYAAHWSYEPPRRPELPAVEAREWARSAVDRFILARLESEGLEPAVEADRSTLARRSALDVTGLPPTLEEAADFLADPAPDAYERLVDRLLARTSYGEHWARKWLDLARYADSAGYADDPQRTIWAYRDWVIRAINDNETFDRFTLEQIAGDLLEHPSEDDLIATAFHRNTLTNNEGGTSDEEFRNVAVVDRVNTTLAVWMGTTMNCAQCHSHKYDPITQEEYFKVFAIFNQSADADRTDESPVFELWSDDRRRERDELRQGIAALRQTASTATPELGAAAERWEASLGGEPRWEPIVPRAVKTDEGAAATIASDASVTVAAAAPRDAYTVELEVARTLRLTAIRLEALAGAAEDARGDAGGPETPGPGHAGGNFVITRVLASIEPPSGKTVAARRVRVDLPGPDRYLSLAEVEVFSGALNIAPKGEARQSSTAFDGPAALAIDGNTDGDYAAKSTTHSAVESDPWWELDLGAAHPIERIVLWNRTDNGLQRRLAGCRVRLFDDSGAQVWETTVAEAPKPSRELSPSGARAVELASAFATFSQSGFEAANVLSSGKSDDKGEAKGWAVAPRLGESHALTLILRDALEIEAGSVVSVRIEQRSAHDHHTLRRFRSSLTEDASAAALAALPAEVLAVLRKPRAERSDDEARRIVSHYLSIAPELAGVRDRLAAAEKRLAELRPITTVPVMRELPADQRRETRLQRRGNFLDVGDPVSPGVPVAFHPLEDDSAPDRLDFARWLVDERNPLTARVLVNRYWEAIFGIGLVRTSEEFGSQGEPPSHPELLDWLATEVVSGGWDLERLVRLLVTSAAYRQSSRVTPELLERDVENRLLARGPRFRMSAEMIRDQALFASGLLSSKMYGPPVKPPQPILGVSAAFGGGIDWTTSDGDDKVRRGIYTTWRRSNPYPSMATFDAPNREVCTVRRDRTNTPLQALVTLNDPVYIEAAQALGRWLAAQEGDGRARLAQGVRRVLIREPREDELARLDELRAALLARYESDPEAARLIAGEPAGAEKDPGRLAALATFTVVANVLLNLDETFMKR